MSIPLPPLPKPESLNCEGWPTLYSRSELRARDLEVARVVLEQAAMIADSRPYAAKAIRALEFKHHE